MRVAVGIELSDDEVLELSKLSKSRSVSVRLAERSRIVLLAGKGMTNEEIGKELGITRQKAGRWRERYAGNGVEGISRDAYRPGREDIVRGDQNCFHLITPAVVGGVEIGGTAMICATKP